MTSLIDFSQTPLSANPSVASIANAMANGQSSSESGGFRAIFEPLPAYVLAMPSQINNIVQGVQGPETLGSESLPPNGQITLSQYEDDEKKRLNMVV